MRQSIRTRYLAVTNHRPNRVKAEASPKSLTLSWGDYDDSDQNHAAAARELAQALGWSGVWVGGCFDGDNRAREWVLIGKVAPEGFEPAGSHGCLVDGKDWFRVA